MTRITISANKARLWDCLNEAYEANPNCTISENKKAAIAIYKSKGYEPLPFLAKQEVFKNYFE